MKDSQQWMTLTLLFPGSRFFLNKVLIPARILLNAAKYLKAAN
jgi:hypothetical protein